jgi:hypothetical protein
MLFTFIGLSFLSGLLIFKFSCVKRGLERGRSSLSEGKENGTQLLLKCKETQKWREKFLNEKESHINEELAHKEITR